MKLLILLAMIVAGCSHVPEDSLKTADNVSPEDNHRYEELVLDGRGSFLKQTRDIPSVERSYASYKQVLAIRADDYVILWEAARTAVWLSNFGPEDKQDDYARAGITWANTAVKIKPDGEEGLFYDGALAGKLAELDMAYGLDGLKIIQKRMRQLIEMKSTYIYGGPDRVLAIVLMRSPGSPIGPGDWDEAEKHMTRALEIDPNWPENQLYMAELEFGLAKKRNDAKYAESARARLQEHFLSEDAKAPMGSKFEFEHWQNDARTLLEDND